MGKELWQHYTKWLKPRRQRVIRLVIRTQGLIVAKGNPLKISSLADLTRPGVRFVNRQSESGTRILLDGLLRVQAIDPRGIAGYDGGEFTHAAVAAFVASGMADAAFGVEPAARQFKLDFIPMVRERYMLAVGTGTLRQASIQELLRLLQRPEFEELIRPVPGYIADGPGQVIAVNEVFVQAEEDSLFAELPQHHL
jgi:molybdate-binding protein